MTNYEISYEIAHLKDEYAAHATTFVLDEKAKEIRKLIRSYQERCTHEKIIGGRAISAFEAKKESPTGPKYCCFCGKVLEE